MFAALLSIVMIGALLFVTFELGLISGEPKTGAELELALLAGLVALMLLGRGPLSVDDQVGLDHDGLDRDGTLSPAT